MHRYSFIAAAAFAIASALYVVLSMISSFDRLVHIATAVVFGVVAVIWTYTYRKERSRPSD